MKQKKKMLSLVLGSGGARGYAHIGVIEALLAQDYEIKSISGSSMGALIGGLYACGKLDAYKEWVLELDFLDVAKLVDFSFTGKGIIQGDKIFHVIEEMIGDVLIEELPIAFTAVATNLLKQKEVWLQKGKVIEAIRASIAIPTIFTPKKIGNRYLVDGGVLNPLPIAPTIADDTDMTIAVSLSATTSKIYNIPVPEKELEKASGMENLILEMKKKAEALIVRDRKKEFNEMDMFDIIGRTIDVMQNSVQECKMAGYTPDMIIGISKDACGFYEFNRAYEIIELGRMIAKEHLEKSKTDI